MQLLNVCSTQNTKILKALHCKNEGRPPVWLMRQAGRYLPEYRALRQKHSLRELFFTPELAAQVTKMPVDLFGLDAAILFSDITVVALALGLKLDFSEGPVIEPMGQVLDRLDVKDVLQPIAKTIEIVKPQLTVPLIGFCGGPFTVASYLIEKHNGQELPITKKWGYREPEKLKALLEKITEVSIDYIQMQVEAGVDCVQIFDSWAHVLTKEHFDQFCAPYLKRLRNAVKVPVILFMRSASQRIGELVAIKPDCISFDWQTPLANHKIPMAVQGNLDPDLLYAPLPVIRKKTNELIRSMTGHKGFIVNLGHGVKPDVPVDAVRCLVDTVKDFSV